MARTSRDRSMPAIAAAMVITSLVAVSGGPVASAPPNANGYWVVDSAGDEPDANPGDGDCSDAVGNCTLRAALQEAEAELAPGVTSTVVFDPILYGSIIPVSSTLVVTTVPGATLTILGPTELINRPVISGGGSVLPLGVYGELGSNGNGSDVNIVGVVISDGFNSTGDPGGGLGTYLGPTGALRLDRVSINDNETTGTGGGLAAANDVSILDSEFERNTTGLFGGGGAISVSGGDLVIERSTIQDNIAVAGGNSGGAIRSLDGAANISVTDSLISGNSAGEGGAIYCECASVDLERVSIVDNSALGPYGGIFVSATGDVSLVNTTIAQNQAGDVSGGAYVVGGSVTSTNSTFTLNTAGVFGPGTVSLNGPTTLTNTIVAGNLGPDFECAVVDATVEGVNFLGSSCSIAGSGPGGEPAGTGVIDTADPGLFPLFRVGGRLTGVGDSLPVVPPRPGSPVIGAGTCVVALDGRGLPRPAANCDVGALEESPAVAADRVFTVNDPSDAVDAIVGDGVCATLGGVCTLRAAILEADVVGGTSSTIEFTGAAVGPLPMRIPGVECTTTEDNAFCGDYDITSARITIRGVDGSNAPATADHPVQIGQLDESIFDVRAPSFVLENLDLLGSGAERMISAGANNTLLTIIDSRLINGWGITAAGPASNRLVLDEVKFENVDDPSLIGAVETARTTEITNSEIGLSDGGAITSTDGALTITASNFVDNTNPNVGLALIGCTAACGPLTMTDSAVFRNTLSGGPAVGTGPQRATVSNSTIGDNVNVIGAISVGAGGLDLANSTVAFNTAGGTPGRHTGGLDLGSAGSVVVENSIVDGNVGVAGALGTPPPPPDDCDGGGTVTLVGVNAFPPDTPGDCNVIGDPPITTDAFLDQSPVQSATTSRGDAAWAQMAVYPDLAPELIDSIAPDRCGGERNPFVRPATGGSVADQRGLARPSGNGCEPGSFEIAVLEATGFSGETDVNSAGASISTNDLTPEATAATRIDGAPDRAGASSTDLRAVDLAATPLRQVPLRQVPLGALATDSDVLDAISLSQIPLKYTSPAGTGWIAYLSDQATATNGLAQLATQPLNTVSLGQVIRATLSASVGDFGLPGLDISQIDFSATPLGALPIGALALGAATLTDIDGRPDGTPWCDIISRYTTRSCGPGQEVDPATASLVTINLLGVPLRQVPLRQVPLRQVDLTASPLRQVPLRQVEIAATPLRQVPLRQVLLEGSPLRQVPLRQVDLLGSPLRQVPLRQVLLEGSPLRQVPLRQVDLLGSPLRQVPLRQVLLADTPLRQVPLRQVDLVGSPLRQVPLRQVANPGEFVDCAVVDCASDTLTLGDVTGDFLDGVTLGELVDAIDAALDLGAALDLDGSDFLAVFGDLTLGDLIDAVAANVDLGSLGDLGGPGFPDAYGDESQGAAFTLGYLLSILAAGVDLGTLSDVDASLFPDAIGDLTLGQLFDLLSDNGLFDDATLGDLGGSGFPDAYGDANSDILLGTIIEILRDFFGDDATLGDLLAGILPASEYPWEQVDLTDPTVVDSAISPSSFTAPVAISLPEDTIVDVQLTLPAGWRVTADSLRLADSGGAQPAGRAPTDITADTDPITGITLVAAQFAVVRPAPDLLSFDATPPIELVATDPIAVDLDAPEWSLDALPVQSPPTRTSDAFEPANNSVGGAVSFGPDPDERLFLTHIGTPTDVDWFRIDVAQGTKLSAYLGSLPDDYDLLLYGPTQVALRGPASSTLDPSPDGGLSLIGQDNGVEAQIADDIDTTPPNSGLRLFGSSTRRGVGDERIDTAALPAGTYYLRISGFGGATSTKPYSLRVRTIPTAISGDCTFVPGPVPVGPALDPSVTTIQPDTNTLILTNLSRMARGYPDAGTAAAAIESFVTTVNANPSRYGGVRAAVVPLDDLDAYAAWDADACRPAAANAVVSQVGDRLDTLTEQFPFVDNIVLIGADDQIPFGRVVDAVPANNESDYAPTFDGTSPLSAAQSLGYVLTDNPYGVSNPIAVGPRELFVPEFAVGRLVESPDDIAEALGHFVDFDGQLDVSTALSTGYDFLTDGAAAVSRELVEPRGIVPAEGLTELISDEWTRDDLRDALVGGAPDLASVNAHFDHYRALPADQDAAGILEDPFEISDVTSAPGDPLLGSVIFSMGCHSGLSVSDISVGGPLDQDWAQTFAAEGAVFAGNTGYGYGDDVVVGATEELMRQFASRLDGSLTVGEAMSFAKQRYTADLLVVSPFDEKVVNQVVFYGLPMYRLGAGEPPAPIVNPDTVEDPATGLETFDTTSAPEILAVSTDSGVYYETEEGGYQATPFQPVQPKITVDVTQEGMEARGAIITDLTTSDVAIDPVYVTPNDDSTTPTPEATVDDAIFPTVPQAVSSYSDPNGQRDQLVIVPGQFRDDPETSTGSGTQRLFDEVSARVFYAPDGNTDVEPATIESSEATVVQGAAVFEVVAGDAGGIAQVLVLFTDADSPATWESATLSPSESDPDTYVGTVTAPAGVERVDYFVQVVDTGGNVAVSTNKGAYYEGETFVEPPPPPTAPTIFLPTPGPSGVYADGVTATITPGSSGGPVSVRVDGAAPVTTPSVTVSGPGLHTIRATGPNGATSEVRFVIAAPVVPTVAASVSPQPSPSGWHRTPPTVTVTGTDVASVSVIVGDGAATTGPSPTTVGPLTEQGDVTVRFFGTAASGAVSSTTSVNLRIDTVPPTITCVAETPTFIVGEPGAEITASVSDAASGALSATTTTAVSTQAAGEFDIDMTAIDVAGNVASSTCPVNVTYNVDGFASPVDNDVVNVAKAGRTVPLKWRLTDYQGQPISDPNSFVNIRSTPGSCEGSIAEDEVPTVTSKAGLKYEGDGNWQFNWKTNKQYRGCLGVEVDFLGGRSALTATFRFR